MKNKFLLIFIAVLFFISLLSYFFLSSVGCSQIVQDVSGSTTGAAGTTTTTTLSFTSTTIRHYSALGELDDTFGSSGMAVNQGLGDWLTNDAIGGFITSDPLGRILVVGSNTAYTAAGNYFESKLAIWRYNENGTLDNSFGSGGVITSAKAEGNLAVIDHLGRIIVAGHYYTTENLINTRYSALWRYDINGNLDESFGEKGIMSIGKEIGNYSSILLDSSGRIIVLTDHSVFRFNSDGIPDNGFGTQGKVTFDASVNYLKAAAIDSSGKLLIASEKVGGGVATQYVSILKLNENGSINAFYDWGSDQADLYLQCHSMLIDPAGKIVVVGYGVVGAKTQTQNYIWRFNPDGTLDASFGTNGVINFSNAGGIKGVEIPQSVAIDPFNKILVAGEIDQESHGKHFMFIRRFDPTGEVDTTFGSTGYVIHAGESGANIGAGETSIILDSQARLLVLGYSKSMIEPAGITDNNMVIWRYR